MFSKFSDRDEFSRHKIAINLIKIFKSQDKISPIALDGPWGSGKSEFCRKLSNLINETEADMKCITIDCFKYDHIDDPLTLIISSVFPLIDNPSKKKKLISKAIPVVKTLGKVSAKAAVSWALKQSSDDISEDISKVISKESESIINSAVKKVFKQFEDIEKDLNSFKEALHKATESKTLVLIIDELDRCRPNFALEMLEKIKHVFDVDGIRFVLSTNITHLHAMIQKQYGQTIDAENYLSKFYSFKVRLPDYYNKHRDDNEPTSVIALKNLLSSDTSLQHLSDSNSNHYIVLQHLFDRDSRSIRDSEQYIQNLRLLNLLGGYTTNTPWVTTLSVVVIAYFYTFNRNFYEKILSNKISLEDLNTSFKMTPGNLASRQDHTNHLSYLYAAYLLDLQEKTGKKILEDQITAEWADTLSKFFTSSGQMYGIGRGNRIGYFRSIAQKMSLSE